MKADTELINSRGTNKLISHERRHIEFVGILTHHNTEKYIRRSHASQGLASPMFPPRLLLTPAKHLLVLVRWECPY